MIIWTNVLLNVPWTLTVAINIERWRKKEEEEEEEKSIARDSPAQRAMISELTAAGASPPRGITQVAFRASQCDRF
jgi:hypothetical protein